VSWRTSRIVVETNGAATCGNRSRLLTPHRSALDGGLLMTVQPLCPTGNGTQPVSADQSDMASDDWPPHIVCFACYPEGARLRLALCGFDCSAEAEVIDDDSDACPLCESVRQRHLYGHYVDHLLDTYGGQ
jgi:hypothetical protein